MKHVPVVLLKAFSIESAKFVIIFISLAAVPVVNDETIISRDKRQELSRMIIHDDFDYAK